MKTNICSFMAAALLLAAPAFGAQGDSPHHFNANVAFTTDYVFRGITQTHGDPAIQGGIEYAHESGFYLGLWGSSLEYRNGSNASLELDYYAGYAGVVNNLGYDVGVIYYDYPGNVADVEYAYAEYGGGLSYSFTGALAPTASAYAWYSPDFFGAGENALALIGSLGLSLPADFGLALEIGNQHVDGGETSPGFEYTWYQAALSKAIGPLSFELAYIDTDDEDECGGDLCDARVVFTVSTAY